MSIVVLGSINIDIAAYGERLPKPGETLHAHRYALGLGGKGANQAAAASRLGNSVQMIGRIGADLFADMAGVELQRYGIGLELVHRDTRQSTGVAIIGVDAKGENAITVVAGANMAIDHSDVARATPELKAAKVLMLQLEIPLAASLEAAATVRSHRGMVILDPAPVPKTGLAPEVFRQVDVITPNEVETEALVGFRPENAEDARRAGRMLRERGVPIAVVKLGARGCLVSTSELDAFVPPYKVETVDSVAAGDCFNGALAHALERKLAVVEAVRFAAAAGAISTTKPGAAASAPTRDQVEALLRRH